MRSNLLVLVMGIKRGKSTKLIVEDLVEGLAEGVSRRGGVPDPKSAPGLDPGYLCPPIGRFLQWVC